MLSLGTTIKVSVITVGIFGTFAQTFPTNPSKTYNFCMQNSRPTVITETLIARTRLKSTIKDGGRYFPEARPY
jgi:hypothetical protein